MGPPRAHGGAGPREFVPGTPDAGRPLVRTTGKPILPAPLRSDITRIAADGAVTVAGVPRAVIACGTTSVGLRTAPSRDALLDGLGRWLNSLGSGGQIVVSAVRQGTA
jgi:hypothetical protein